MTIELLSAEQFTFQELTDLYNQTRVDYLVPMPMNTARLQTGTNMGCLLPRLKE